MGDVERLENVDVKVTEEKKTFLTGEHFADSERGHAFAFVGKRGVRSEELKKLDTTQGERISKEWRGTEGVMRRMDATGQVYVSCLRTLKSSSLAPGNCKELTGGVKFLADDVKVQVHSVFLREAQGTNPVYFLNKNR